MTVPASFLPAPKRERKHFDDEALFEAPAEVSHTHGLTKLQAAALEEKPWLTKPLPALADERRLARAVSALLVGVPR